MSSTVGSTYTSPATGSSEQPGPPPMTTGEINAGFGTLPADGGKSPVAALAGFALLAAAGVGLALLVRRQRKH